MSLPLARARTAVIFGGTGCIGTHIANHLLQHTRIEKIYLADLKPLRPEDYLRPILQGMEQRRVVDVRCDVRQPFDVSGLPGSVDLIVNLAATHREPGHEPSEYYATNLQGAENVCAYATRAGCTRMVFTSSIAPYGSSDDMRNEDSLPVPETAYGGSKLVAEKIHQIWQSADASRQLVVLRPGVVFGAGEHANVARLAHSLARGYFVYMGNRLTRKAGIYAKELAFVMQFALEHQEATGQPMILSNVSLDPPPTLKEFVDAICAVAGFRRPRLSVPRRLLIAMAYPVEAVAQLFGIRQPISPVRMRKLSQPTHIEPMWLREAGYRWHYTLEQAMADWRRDAPQDFR